MASIIKVDTIQSTTANVFFQNSSGTEYARFDSGGNLGIGTTSPAYKIDAVSTDGIFKFTKSGGATGYLLMGGSSANFSYDTSGNYAWAISSTDLQAWTAGTKRMTITSAGDVGIGTSAPATTNGAVTLNVGLKSANNTVLGFETTNLQYGGSLEFRRTARTTQSRFAQITGAEDNSGNGLLYFYTAAAGSDVSENMRLDGSGNLKFNSGYGSAATAYGCRAWVNFNGTGTVAIRASGNVTSITDNNVGNYTVNFTNAMPDANYAVTFGVGGGGSGLNSSFVAGVLTSTQYGTASNKNTTAVQFTTGDYTATLRDLGEIYVSIFR